MSNVCRIETANLTITISHLIVSIESKIVSDFLWVKNDFPPHNLSLSRGRVVISLSLLHRYCHRKCSDELHCLLLPCHSHCSKRPVCIPLVRSKIRSNSFLPRTLWNRNPGGYYLASYSVTF